MLKLKDSQPQCSKQENFVMHKISHRKRSGKKGKKSYVDFNNITSKVGINSKHITHREGLLHIFEHDF